MGADDWENRSASDKTAGRAWSARRSVSGPYRDDEAALRETCEGLRRQVEELKSRQVAPAPSASASASGRRGWVIGVAFFVGALSVFPFSRVPPVVHRGSGLVRIDVDHYFISRAWAQRVARGVDVVPVIDDEVIVGLRLAASSELVTPLGIREGDVFMAIDDHWIRDPNGARDAWATVTRADHFSAVVRRRGAFRSIVFDVIE